MREFCDHSGRPYLVFQAPRGRNPAAAREEFTATIAQSPFSGAELVAGIRAGDWTQALRAPAIALPDDTPSIAVIDEVPRLVELEPLNVADVRAMTALDAATATDATLITGGFPEIVRSWRPEWSRLEIPAGRGEQSPGSAAGRR